MGTLVHVVGILAKEWTGPCTSEGSRVKVYAGLVLVLLWTGRTGPCPDRPLQG